MEAVRPQPRDGADSTVATIASRFTGGSQPIPEAAHIARVSAAIVSDKDAAKDASAAHHAFRGSGDDVMSEHLRWQRLEAYARRRAEQEARENLTRYRGSHALALAYTRASLGLPLSDDEVRLLGSAQGELGLDLGFTAESIERERATALALYAQQRSSQEAMEAGAAAHARPPLPPRGPDHVRSPTATAAAEAAAAEAAQREAGEAMSHARAVLDAEAEEVMSLITAIVRDAGAPLSLAEVSSAIHDRTHHFWGQQWEPRHGSLLHFVRSHLTPGVHVLTHNRWLSLAGMPPMPPVPQAPAQGSSVAVGSAGYASAGSQAPLGSAPSSTGTMGALVPHAHSQPQPMVVVPAMMTGMGAPYQQQQQQSMYGGYAAAGDAYGGSYQGYGGQAGAYGAGVSQQQQQQWEWSQWEQQQRQPTSTTSGWSDPFALQQQQQQYGGGTASFNPFDEGQAPAATLTQSRGPSTSISGSEAWEGAGGSEREAALVGRRTLKTLMQVETNMEVNEVPARAGRGTSGIHTRVPSRTEARVPAPVMSMSVLPSAPAYNQQHQYQQQRQQSYQYYGGAGASDELAGAPLHGYALTPPPGTVLVPVVPSAGMVVPGASGVVVSGGRQSGTTSSTITTTTTTSSSSAGRYRGVAGGGTTALTDLRSHTGGGVAGGSGNFEREAERLASSLASRTGSLTEGDESLTWTDFDALFRPILQHGVTLIKHGRSGAPKARRMWFSASFARLMWASDSLMSSERSIPMAEVHTIVYGVGTDNLRSRRARGMLIPAGPGGDEVRAPDGAPGSVQVDCLSRYFPLF